MRRFNAVMAGIAAGVWTSMEESCQEPDKKDGLIAVS
jgi:hypothetical protein